ncbi:MAG TPA: phosphodiester glycosidase family protein, partial [Candidatus Aphodomonas merdavium]|nr:phosphodiester glycosidase family protein [Candidatus Aphodomonas merdavium]
FNLDGGGSTTLYFNGEIINKPAAGEERKVSDIIMFMR